MTLPSYLSPTILSASINHIAPLFLAGAKGDEQAARNAVTDLLADYRPQTNEELTLAADIVHYRFLATDNLTRSSDPDLPLTKVLRLRGSAVSLSREAHKAQRKLDKLQSTRATLIAETAPAETVPQPQPTPPAAAGSSQPPPTPAELAALHVARDILNGKKPTKPSKYGGQNYAQQLSKRAMVLTMKENAARISAEAAAAAAAVQAV
jgi:hypothetical protein